MKKNLRTILLFLYFLDLQEYNAFAQELNNPVSNAMGGAGLTAQNHWMIFSNPSGIACEKNFVIGTAVINSFLLKELNRKIISSAFPTGNFGVAGIGFAQSGYSLCLQQEVLIGWSKNYSDKFSLGTAVSLNRLHLGEGYGDVQTIKVKAGFQAKLTNAISIAALIDNPQKAKISEYNSERSPSLFSIGLSNQFSDKLIIYLDCKGVSGNPLKFCSGLEYHPYPQIILRGGISTGPLSGSFGFGIIKKNLHIELGVSHHPLLGFSPAISLTYKREKSNPE